LGVFKMADSKRSRAAKLGARTRARNVSLRGPTQRSSARNTENARIDNGEATLADAYGGVPSHANFLKKADLFERPVKGSKATNTAYIVPGGLRLGKCQLFWYRRNLGIDLPSENETIEVSTKGGDKFTLEALETTTTEWLATLGNQTFARNCTGVGYFLVSNFRAKSPSN
jgi:hypothetical protein